MKKIIFLMLFALVGWQQAEAQEFFKGGLYYNVTSSNTVEIAFQNQEPTGIVTIPEQVTYNGDSFLVTSISNYAFDSCFEITSITIPNSVSNIGIGAFVNCSGLTSVTIPNSVSNIGIAAFQNCSGLTSVTIPDSVTSIGNYAFAFCPSLTSVICNIATPLTINANVFAGVNQGLCSLTVPASSLAAYRIKAVWQNFSPITAPCYPTENTTTVSACETYTWANNGQTYTTSGVYTGTTTDCVTEKLELTIADPTANFSFEGINYIVISPTTAAVGSNPSASGNLVIPASVTIACGTYSVTSIGHGAFAHCGSLTSISIPSSVTSIGNSAFEACGLISVSIPNSVTTLGERVFSTCHSLTSITIPNSVISIGEYAFQNCYSLISVNIPNSITSISNGAFDSCGLISVSIPNSVSNIGSGAFQNCWRLETVNIPNSVNSIGVYAFLNCYLLTSVIISNSVTSIGEGVFAQCETLESVTIPNSVSSIGAGAFQGCSGLTSVTIPNSVTTIGSSAFNQCRSLTSITFPDSVTSIDDFAFAGCSGLTSVICNIATPLTINANVFQNLNQGACSLTVPASSLAAYRIKAVWQNFSPISCGTQTLTTFAQVAPICSGAQLTALPTTSNEGISGTWSPALNNTATTTYTFTPTAGQCATTTTLTISVNQNITPTVTIASNPGNNITTGTTVTFTATPTNGGTTPAYQWRKNGNNVGTNSITYTDAALENGDSITCALTNNYPCASPVTTTSTGITMAVSYPCPAGTTWTSRTPAADNYWTSVTYGNGLFVAVAASGIGNRDRVMTSPDGITWNIRTSATNNEWYSVTYGNGLFVAVAGTGRGDSVMTSPDGITWTSRTSAADNLWYSVTYGNGLFVAVASSGTGNRVMTSSDGITWTSRTSAADNLWYSVTYGNGLFVAVAAGGTSNRVMTSTDGITWTSRTSAADNSWTSVTYGNGVFVAVAQSGTADSVMTSPDGITWTSRISAALNGWRSITYGNGLFVAVAITGTGTRVMASPDGITWNRRTSAADNQWRSVTYSNGVFVAVASSGVGNRVMTSSPPLVTPSVTIASNPGNSVTTGTSVTFAATPSNGGTTPAYQWRKNGNNVGTNSVNYTDAALANGDFIDCAITSNDPCATTVSATSTGITMAVVATPAITTVGTLSAFASCSGTASAEQTFTVSGSNLTDNIIVTAPTGFELSTTSGSGFTSSVTITPSSGAVTSTTVYLRLTASSSGAPSGNFTCVSTGATTQIVAVSGIVNPNIIPTFTAVDPICAGGSLSALPTTCYNGITGTWSPALNNLATTTYTFTPATGQCATTATMTVIVNPSTENITTLSACGSYTWANNGQTYTTSGVYTGTTTNCVTQKLNLSITPAPTSFTSGALNYVVTSPTTVALGSNPSASGNIVIPASVTTACGTYAVTRIGATAFIRCSGLTSVIIPNSVISIDDYAFQVCSGLTSVTIPSSVTSIGVGAFNQCRSLSLTSIPIPNSVTSIGNYAFESCLGLTTVIIPNSVTSIGEGVFANCPRLTSVTIPSSVTSIGTIAFQNSYGLTSISIPNSVTIISQSAFSGCSSLTSVICNIATPLTINANVFQGVTQASCSLTVPASSVAAYRIKAVWQNFSPITYITTYTTSWDNGVPTADATAVIAGDYTTTGSFTTRSLTVNATRSLTVATGTSVTVATALVNNGTITVENNANLIQTAVANTNSGSGMATVNRNGSTLFRQDYTLWSSPVAPDQTLKNFSQLTVDPRFYQYNESIDRYNAVNPLATTFATGKGYLIRMPDQYPANSGNQTPYYLGQPAGILSYPGVFRGIFNNGNISVTLAKTSALKGYQAVGNPYPSVIDAQTFLTANSTNIENTLYFWRKRNGASGSSYATWTSGGSTSNEIGVATPNGKIQVGQGFIVQAKNAVTVSNFFTNAMRDAAPSSTQFFKTKQQAQKDRLWLNLTSNAGVFSQALVAYIDDATLGLDQYDGKYINDSDIALTTSIVGDEYTIQGRPAFDATDIVALNFKTSVSGTYTIAIDHVDGLFTEGQDIYLVDKTTGITTNLNEGAYTFKAQAEVDNTRFSLKYQKTLKVDAPVFNENSVTVFRNNGVVTVNSTSKTIKTVQIYDIQGRLIAQQKNVNATKASFNNLKTASQVLIVKVIADDNTEVSKKVLN